MEHGFIDDSLEHLFDISTLAISVGVDFIIGAFSFPGGFNGSGPFDAGKRKNGEKPYNNQ
jgi:hypothetical protein